VTKKCQYCPPNLPFFNGKECGPCPGNGSYWNTTSLTCNQCFPGGTWSALLQQCECTGSTPYQVAGPRCIGCPVYQYFNYSSQACQNCSGAQIYN
jgi:hypothetical protein